MRKLILHIGISKTGTSSIQAFLTRNYDLLKGKGVLYPMIKYSGEFVATGSHNLVADSLLDKTSYLDFTAEQFFKQFDDTLIENDVENMILSGEHFFTGHPRVWDVKDIDEFYDLYTKKIERLSKLIGNFECYLVVYLRNQISWFESTVAQNIRSEWLIGKRVYENDMQFARLLSPIMDYEKLLNIWVKLIPFEKVFIRDFERVIDEFENITKDFINIVHDITNIELPLRYIEDKVNESWTHSIVQFKKDLNIWKKGESLERGIIASLSKLNRSQVFFPYSVDSSVRTYISERFSSSNEMLEKKYNISLNKKKQERRKRTVSYSKLNFYVRLFLTPTLYFETVKCWLKKKLRDNFPMIHTKLHQIKIKGYKN